MGSYKWGHRSPNMGCKYSYATFYPLITTHEPPNRGKTAQLSFPFLQDLGLAETLNGKLSTLHPEPEALNIPQPRSFSSLMSA